MKNAAALAIIMVAGLAAACGGTKTLGLTYSFNNSAFELTEISFSNNSLINPQPIGQSIESRTYYANGSLAGADSISDPRGEGVTDGELTVYAPATNQSWAELWGAEGILANDSIEAIYEEYCSPQPTILPEPNATTAPAATQEPTPAATTAPGLAPSPAAPANNTPVNGWPLAAVATALLAAAVFITLARKRK